MKKKFVLEKINYCAEIDDIESMNKLQMQKNSQTPLIYKQFKPSNELPTAIKPNRKI